MAWFYIIIAGLLEIVWAMGLKYSDGFSKTLPTTVTIVASLASFYFLSSAMKTIPVGTAYAAWTGIGIVGTTIFGMIYFGESRDLIRIGCIVLIIAAIFVLKLTSE